MNDLISFDTTKDGIFLFGPYDDNVGMAVYFQPIYVQTETSFEIYYEDEQQPCVAGKFLSPVDSLCKSCMVGCRFCQTLAVCQECYSTLLLSDAGLCICADRTYQNGA